MLTRLAHVCLHVADIQRTIDFYHGKLGLPIAFTFARAGTTMGAMFQIGERSFIEAFQVAAQPVVNTGLVHFSLECDDLDGFIRDMRAKGVDCTDKKLGAAKAWATWLVDPDGNRFEINAYTDASAHLIGGVAHVTW